MSGDHGSRGRPVASLDTPALVIDVEALERNLDRMAAYARAHRLRLRPHAKTHKCAAIARMQIERGAVGVCVQKIAEAEALAAAGIADIYVTNEVVDPSKLRRFADLAARATLGIAVDSTLGIERLAAALAADGTQADVFVEVDVGHGRCGVAPAAAGALAHQVVSHGLRFAGLQAYQGRAQHLRGAAERATAIHAAIHLARAAQASVSAAGLACPLVTGGGTGSFVHEAGSDLYGEIQPGSYVFMDRDYADNEASTDAPAFEHALFVRAQVMSRGIAHAVVDAGHKAHAIDSGLPRVWERELEYANGGDEHGILRVRAGASNAGLPELGEAVWLVPGHCDPTVNLHDRFAVVRGGLDRGWVEAAWPIEARGSLQ